MMDVVSRKCQVTGCLKRPWYSYDGMRSVLCAEHKTPGMIGYRPGQKDVTNGTVVGAEGIGMGSIDIGTGVDVGVSGAVGNGGGGSDVSVDTGEVGGIGASRKRTYDEMGMLGGDHHSNVHDQQHPQHHHEEQHHHQEHPHHHQHHGHPDVIGRGGGGHAHCGDGVGGGVGTEDGVTVDRGGATDLVVSEGLDSVGLDAMSMGAVEAGLEEARALGFDGMGGDVLEPSRMEDVGVDVGVPGLGEDGDLGGLDPTGMSIDHHHHHLGHHPHHHHHQPQQNHHHHHVDLAPRGLETTDLDVGEEHHHHHHVGDDLDLHPESLVVGPSDKLFP